MARTKPVLPRLSEAEKFHPHRTRAVKQPGIGGRIGRPSVGGKTPAHLHHYTGTAPGGLGKSFYPRVDPPRRSKRRHRLTLPPLPGPKPHNRVAHEVRYYQKSTNLLIPRATFEEYIRFVAYKVTSSLESDHWDDGHVRFTPQCLEAIQEAAEYFLAHAFIMSRIMTAVAKRKTCFPIDFRLGLMLRDHGGL